MVQLHALEAGVDGIRATMDVDVLARAVRPEHSPRSTRRSSRDGFELQLPADGVVRRYLRRRTDRRRSGARRDARGTGVPGGSQALARSETVTSASTAVTFVLRRPTLLGAILIKARSLLVHRDPEAQREDLLLLLSLVDDPRAMSEQMKRSSDAGCATHRAARVRPSGEHGADRMRLARLTLRLLLREPEARLLRVCGPNAAHERQRATARTGPRNTKGPACRAFVRSPLPDSNRRPLPYHGSALPTELRGRAAWEGSA